MPGHWRRPAHLTLSMHFMSFLYFALFIAVALLVWGIIVLLHRGQLRQRSDIVERSAPLAALDLDFIDTPANPTGTGSAVAARVPDEGSEGNTDNWLEQVKHLRDSGEHDAALQLCRQQFPRIQAFQQAGVLLRQRVRERIDAHQPVTRELTELYRCAVLADLYRNSNPLKPREPGRTLQQLNAIEFDYMAIGTRQLRLLTKSDVKHLEQLWGRPARHAHAEAWSGLDWQQLCQ